MKNKLGFVARSRNARARAEAKQQAWIESAPIREQLTTLRDLDRARGDVLSASEAVAEAEAAVGKWTGALKQYRAHTGLNAEPREVRDLTARVDIAQEALATRRHALADAEARLAVMVPAAPKKAKG